MAKTFTPKELARYNGKQGRPAYAAVDGTVYDLSSSDRWPEGEHVLCDLGARAGHDLSQEILYAPSYMRERLAQRPVVGRLVAEKTSHRAVQGALGIVFVALLAVPFIAMGLAGFTKSPASWTSLRVIAMEAFTLLFVDVFIGAFRPLLTKVVKTRPLQRFHEGVATAVLVIALSHGLLALSLGIRGYAKPVLFGPLVLVLLIITVGTALNRRRIRRGWRWIHRLNYVLFALVVAHAYLIGNNLLSQTFLRVIFLVYAGIATAGLAYRVNLLVRRPAAQPFPKDVK